MTQPHKDIRELSDSDLANRLSMITCGRLFETFDVLVGAVALRNNRKDDTVASRLGQLAAEQENQEALILLEAMRRISPKDL